MSLQEKPGAIREGARQKIPPAAWATMTEATDALRASGIMDSVIKVGARLPAFTLPNAAGTLVSSASLLAKGPLVLTVFRGHW